MRSVNVLMDWIKQNA